MKFLHFAEGLNLPLDAVTQKLAYVGRTGTGKSYGASKSAEEMLDNDAQVVVLDPVGPWAGLRLPGDGPGERGFEVPVFGGLNGDVPLEPGAGALIADLIVDRGVSAVLDVSQMLSSEQARFATDFATRFFQRKKAAPSAVHLFLEECQEFVPQNAQPGEQRMLHAFERLVKLGRNFGIGVSLISQRPQEVNKKCLNQTECLFAFQMTGPQERKAMVAWMSDKGMSTDVADTLPGLAVGECLAWSPSWLRVNKRVRVLPKRSADASSTPKVGAKARAAKPLTPIDLDAIKTAMAETIQRAKADDPKELRRRIAELEKELKAKPASANIERVEIPVLTERERDGLAGAEKMLDQAVAHAEKAAGLVKIATDVFRELQQAVGARAPKPIGAGEYVRPESEVATSGASGKPRATAADNGHQRPENISPSVAHSAGTATLGAGESRVLEACAWMESIGQVDADTTAVAFLAGYTVNGHFNNMRGKLRSAGLIEYPGDGTTRLTDAGRRAAPHVARPHTLAALHQAVIDRLDANVVKLLRPLLAAYPESVTTERLAAASGYTVNGHFNNMKGRLRTLGLATYPRGNEIRAAALLFPKGIS